jgi:hypothetical protein
MIAYAAVRVTLKQHKLLQTDYHRGRKISIRPMNFVFLKKKQTLAAGLKPV